MIISRTPYRISFFGGGTDHPNWYRNHESSVISTTIDKYCYVNLRELPPFFDFKYRLRYYKREEVKTISNIKHPVIREVLTLFKYKKGIDLSYIGDIPAMSGVGSSSAFTVGIINALEALRGGHLTKRELANYAIKIEQDILKENVGSQDQIASAFGGLNIINFKNNEYEVVPLILNSEKKQTIEQSITLLFTGLVRNSNNIAKNQISNIKKKYDTLNEMYSICQEGKKLFLSNKFDKKMFGKLMHQQWLLKKELNEKSTNTLINDIYNEAINSGAYGGKIIGAGGGGFIMLIGNSNFKKEVKKKFSKYLILPIKFENFGSKIVYYTH